MEIGQGLWEGKLESEIRDGWSDLLDTWKRAPETVQMPEGETIQDVWARSVTSWQEIAKGPKPEETSLVVYDAVNKTILCDLLGLTLADIWAVKQGNGGVTVVDINPDPSQPAVVTCLNLTSHFGSVIDRTAAAPSNPCTTPCCWIRSGSCMAERSQQGAALIESGVLSAW